MKRSRLLAALFALAALVLVATPTRAQTQPNPVSIKQVTDEAGSATVVTAVMDATGRPVAGLNKERFKVSVDGVPATVEEVRYATDPQLTLGLVLVIDSSGSMAGARLASAKQAAKALLDGLAPGDQVALLVFNQTPVFFSGFTTDRSTITRIIDGIVAAGDTALYAATRDAVVFAAGASFPRKTVVLVSDGENFGNNQVTRAQAIEAAGRVNVPVYAVGLGGETDRPYLDELARVSRGESRHAPTPADLDRLYRDIGETLRGQYIISVRPAPVQRAATHTLKIDVDLGGASASDQVSFPGTTLATLPEATPTPIPSSSPAPSPTAVATSIVTAVPTVVASPVPETARAEDSNSGKSWVGVVMNVGVLLVAGGAFAWLWWRRRAPLTPLPSGTSGEPGLPLPVPVGAAFLKAVVGQLQVVDGPLRGHITPVTGEPITIGTDGASTVVIPAGMGVEPRHVRLWYRDGRFMLHQIARHSTVEVEGKPVQWVVLESGDSFRIGPHEFFFSIGSADTFDTQRIASSGRRGL